jgi:hypothetical protein
LNLPQRENEDVLISSCSEKVDSLARVFVEPFNEDDWEILVTTYFY